MVLGLKTGQSSCRLWPSRTLHPVIAGITILLTAGSTALMTIEPANALRQIEFKPSFLLDAPLPLTDLETFVSTGEKSDDLQFLLDLIVGFGSLGEEEVRTFLASPISVDGVLLERFLNSTIGEVIAKEVVLILQPDNADPNSWQDVVTAFAAAGQDNQATVLEVLQQYQPDVLEIDVQRVTKIQQRINEDVTDFQEILGIEITGQLNAGVKDLFCTPETQQSDALMALVNSFTDITDAEVQEVLSNNFETDAALVDRFLTSFFGEIFLKHLALTLAPGDTQVETTDALKSAISAAGQDNNFSVFETLENYQPNQIDANVDKLTAVVSNIRNDVQDFQEILGLEGAEDISAVVREVACPVL